MSNKKDKIINEQHTPSPYLSLFYFSKKEVNLRQKVGKTRHAYSKERTRQREHLNNELTCVDKLLEEGSINQDLHTRYKKILEIDYAKKRLKTREKYGFKTHL